MLITDSLRTYSRSYPEKIALVDEEQCITYQELDRQIDGFARYLSSLGPMENKACLFMKNRIEFLTYFLGAARAGWIAVPLDPKWSKQELNQVMVSVQPKVLVVDKEWVDKLPDLPQSTQIVFSQNVPVEETCQPSHSVADTTLFYMGFTSGTTGVPKGFVRSHRSWVKSFEGSAAEFGFTSEDVVCSPGALVHSTFLYAAVHALHIGATVILLEKFTPSKCIAAITQWKVSVLYMVPTMFEAINLELKDPRKQLEGNDIRAILSAGAKWSPESKRRVAQWFPQGDLYEFYGASELSFVAVIDLEGNKKKPDSVGRPFYRVEVSIRDEQGQDVPIGVVGKLFVRSDYLFAGYYDNEAETQQVLVADGWATVHDMARQDHEGYIYLVGREKNMILYGGLNVYPEEVEKVIKLLPNVEDVAVLGKPDKYWGEKIVAAILLKPNATIPKQVIQNHCRKHLAPYKCPREIEFVKELPYTTSGKVARKQIFELLFGSEVKS
ncbi:AMP-binding protein [Ammoniphilus sp. YIM 78166]|uniref:AMP-binding protein n=1 Tax=Ammoniphilus sp. YIM 78166 TaxID=1644106 RepID=UPI00106F0AB4|nr:AMP-binding protein [Ammoniphilus sp. YIM 78166]